MLPKKYSPMWEIPWSKAQIQSSLWFDTGDVVLHGEAVPTQHRGEPVPRLGALPNSWEWGWGQLPFSLSLQAPAPALFYLCGFGAYK